MIVNMMGLADILGVTRPTIRARMTKGLPYENQGREGRNYEFNTEKVIQWHIEQALKDLTGPSDDTGATLHRLKVRKALAETESTEIQVENLKAQVVTHSDAVEVITTAVGNIGDKVRELTSRAAPRVIGLIDENDVKGILEEEVDATLHAIHEHYKDTSK